MKTLYLDRKGSASTEGNQQSITWHHINYSNDEDRAWVKQQDISISTAATLLAADNRPRLILEEKSLILCLRGINMNQSDSPEDMISIRLWVNEDTIITSGKRDSKSLRNIREQLKKNSGPVSVADFLISLLEQLAVITDDFVDLLDEMLDTEEDSISDSDFELFNPRMIRFRRQIATIKRFLAPQKEALDKLFRSKVGFLNEEFYDNLYIQIDKFLYILENLNLLQERALLLQEQLSNWIGHQQNSRLYLLSIISAIFLPLTFLSGLLGMNVGGMPGLNSVYAFWIVSGFCIIIAITLFFVFKRKKWF